MGSEPDSGVGFPESDSGSGTSKGRGSNQPLLDKHAYSSFLTQENIQRSYFNSSEKAEEFDYRRFTDTMGKPLKGILKNNQFQSLPRHVKQNELYLPGTLSNLPNFSNGVKLNERLKNKEVIDTVESSV